jgi:hypothetical protein
MDKREAMAILDAHLARFRLRPYQELLKLLDGEEHLDAVGESGTVYQLEFNVFWDDKPGGNLRVMGSIDDGGIRACCPLTRDFVIAPDGRLIGE